MKNEIQNLIHQSLLSLISNNLIALADEQIPKLDQIKIERCRDKSHGDFATNIAMVIAKRANTTPRDLAEKIVSDVQANAANQLIQKIDIAGPGFINMTLNAAQHTSIIETILNQKEQFGHNDYGQNKKIQIEFVSANPTGPLHVGHGRGAAYGASLANLLSVSGYQVDCEYYVNDAGRQMDILGTSTWLRFLQANGVDIPFPSNGYQGDYILDLIKTIDDSESLPIHSKEQILSDLPQDEIPDAPEKGGDKEAYIDAMIAKAKSLLGEKYEFFFNLAKDDILADIKEDLEEFGVRFNHWYSEKSLMSSKAVDTCITELKENQCTYEKDKTLWFKSTDFGDDKDRVIQRDNGLTTYFASDIAYHEDKFKRGYDELINIWGADHHGYIARVKAALKALKLTPEALQMLLVQFANLYRAGEKVQMSTRSGSFVTLRELREEVGNDAARFFYVMRKCEQHLDFDLDIAKSKTSENPVYYIQYAHARICSVLRQMEDKGIKWEQENAVKSLSLLNEEHETDLLSSLSKYPEMLLSAAKKREPHLIAHYCRDLAHQMHAYYNQHHFIVDDQNLRDSRIALILAVQQVIKNALTLLGVSAPTEM